MSQESIDQSKINESPEVPLENESGLRFNVGEVYPDAKIKVSRDQYSVFELKKMAELHKELIIAPPYQRGNVWKIPQKVELIESVIMGIPLPVIYLFEEQSGLKQLVDGRQRVTALFDFMDNKFTLNDLKILPIAFNKKKYQDLDPIYQSKIDRFQLAVYIIEPPTPERVKYDIFDRVNRGGTQLNNQEMRNALYQGKSTKLLDKLSASAEFLLATGNGIQSTRMRDKYIILRFLAFYMWKENLIQFEYKSNLQEFLAEVMRKINAADDVLVHKLEETFLAVMHQSYQVLGEDAFRFAASQNKRPINMTLFETIAYFFAKYPANETPVGTIKLHIEKLKSELDKTEKFSKNADTAKGVEFRFQETIATLRDRLKL